MGLKTAVTWRVNPLVGRSGLLELTPAEREIVAAGDALGSAVCELDRRMPHCHGAEIVHADGVAECVQHPGEPCTAPGGLHMHVHSCAPDGPRYRHACARCR